MQFVAHLLFKFSYFQFYFSSKYVIFISVFLRFSEHILRYKLHVSPFSISQIFIYRPLFSLLLITTVTSPKTPFDAVCKFSSKYLYLSPFHVVILNTPLSLVFITVFCFHCEIKYVIFRHSFFNQFNLHSYFSFSWETRFGESALTYTCHQYTCHQYSNNGASIDLWGFTECDRKFMGSSPKELI